MYYCKKNIFREIKNYCDKIDGGIYNFFALSAILIEVTLHILNHQYINIPNP